MFRLSLTLRELERVSALVDADCKRAAAALDSVSHGNDGRGAAATTLEKARHLSAKTTRALLAAYGKQKG